MIPFLTQRGVEASLWQSAVDEAVASRATGAPPIQRPNQQNPFAHLASLGASLLAHWRRATPTAALGAAPFADVSQLGVTVAALADSFAGDEAQFREQLRLAKFGQFDPLWIEAGVNYLRFLKFHRKNVPYQRYQDLSDFVIDDKLPAQAKVALLSDWGTGQQEAIDLLKQVAGHEPDVVIHLGDIYYSGLPGEDQDRFWQPWNTILDLTRVVTFTLSGNHDMYSGGQGYYGLLQKLKQPASYFCLRNDHWQFVAMDTGLNSGVSPLEVTKLKDEEAVWICDKVQNARGRRTVLLSHHPLFSAFEKIGAQSDGINHNLLNQLGSVLPEITCWFWGHEHDLAIYDIFEGLKARCIGHGAIPVSEASRPRPNPQLPIKVLAPQKPLGITEDYFNHGYVIIELDGDSARARYYQSSDADNPQHEEVFA